MVSGRYIKRYIYCFFWVSLSSAIFLILLFLLGNIELKEKGAGYLLLVLKNNLNLLVAGTLFLTLFYYFQTREINTIKALLFSFLILCIITSSVFFLFYLKPKKPDITAYKIQDASYKKLVEKYTKTNIISSPDYIIKYAAFIKDKQIFSSLTIVTRHSPEILSSDTGKIIKTAEDFFLYIPKPRLIETSTPKEAIKIHLFKVTKTGIVFDRIITAMYRLKNKYTFYESLKKLYLVPKKNIHYFLNVFLYTTGIAAVFMIFALVFAFSNNRFLNLSLSFPGLFLAYTAIFYINKIPFYKLKFLDKGVLKSIKTGLAMAFVAVVILVISIFVARAHSKKRGGSP